MVHDHHEHPEIWFRPSPQHAFSVLYELILRSELTSTFRLGKRDGNHPKGYVPRTVATLRLFDEVGNERLFRSVCIALIESKPLMAYGNCQSIQEELSYFEGRDINPFEQVSAVTFKYVKENV